MASPVAANPIAAAAPAAAAQPAEAVALLDTLLGPAPVGLAILDPDLRYVWVNGDLAAQNGLPPEQHRGRTLREVLPALAPALEPVVRGVTETGQPAAGVGIAGETPARPGERRHWLASYYPVRAAGGAPVGVGAIVQEVTDTRRAEDALRFLADASRQLASSLDYDATLERVVRLALPFLAEWCYVALLEAGQFRVVAVAHTDPAKEPLAWELQRRYPPNPDSTRAGGFSTALRTGQAFLDAEVSDARMVGHARDARHLELLRALEGTSYVVAPLVARGQTLGVMVFFSAAARRRYGPDDVVLAEEVARRAAVAVDNARLYREAQEGIRVRDEFLSTAAHELKTPVTIAKGYAQLLRRRPPAGLAPREAHALVVLDGQCDRLNRLVQDFLDVSLARGGHLDLHRAPCDLGELVAAVVERVQATTTAHRLRLLRLPERPAVRVEVDVDRERIEQVLVNLLGNAIKFSPDGGDIEVRMGVRAREAVVAVRDEGVGVPRDRQARLFEQFYRAHAGTPHDYGGMGIGLHLSREIVTRHGGQMWFASDEGRGSTFSFSLPAAQGGDVDAGA
jgi:signal transduction histidine kinase